MRDYIVKFTINGDRTHGVYSTKVFAESPKQAKAILEFNSPKLNAI